MQFGRLASVAKRLARGLANVARGVKRGWRNTWLTVMNNFAVLMTNLVSSGCGRKHQGGGRLSKRQSRALRQKAWQSSRYQTSLKLQSTRLHACVVLLDSEREVSFRMQRSHVELFRASLSVSRSLESQIYE